MTLKRRIDPLLYDILIATIAILTIGGALLAGMIQGERDNALQNARSGEVQRR